MKIGRILETFYITQRNRKQRFLFFSPSLIQKQQFYIFIAILQKVWFNHPEYIVESKFKEYNIAIQDIVNGAQVDFPKAFDTNKQFNIRKYKGENTKIGRTRCSFCYIFYTEMNHLRQNVKINEWIYPLFEMYMNVTRTVKSIPDTFILSTDLRHRD